LLRDWAQLFEKGLENLSFYEVKGRGHQGSVLGLSLTIKAQDVDIEID
jgi:hypothetical protein